MNLPHASQFIPPAALGVSGVSLPWWLAFLPPIWQGFVAILGAVVLMLTILKLVIEIRAKLLE